MAGFGFLTTEQHPEPFALELWKDRLGGFELGGGRAYLRLLCENKGAEEQRIKEIRKRTSS